VIDVYLEVGQKRVFACAVDWPGWSRSGKTEDDAIGALLAYADRYAPVAKRAGLKLPAAREAKVVERVRGSATTDFGAPGELPEVDKAKVTPATGKRIAALVAAAWDTFDDVVKHAPLELRKGPRGGGRNRDKIVEHVRGAEEGYARAFGVRDKENLHAALLDAIEHGRTREDGGGWPPRKAARRIAWHALDHAWEIEDRTEK
jgi:hypothetical protein